MNKIFFGFIISLLSLSNSYAQSKEGKQLAKKLDDLISKRFTTIAPGCVVLVAKKGEIIYKKAFGSANLELNVPMQPDMIFWIGSITKQYTAIAILQLLEQGKISLQDSIQKYIKDFPSKGYTITIENLLTHTSGIKNLGEIPDPIPNAERQDYTPKQVIDNFKNEPLRFKPGSKFDYSNSNYYLLGYIIETVSGMAYQKYLQQNIFKPNGLSNTYYIEREKIIGNRVSGYTKQEGKFENADYVSASLLYAAGALMSNADDLFKWHQSLYNNRLVTREILNKAFTPYKLTDSSFSTYGYGWFIKNIAGSKTIEHGGSIDGFQSDEIYFPNEDVFVAALFNGYEPAVNWTILSNDIAKISIGKPLNSEVKLDEAILKQYFGVYEYDSKNKLIVTLENGSLFIEDTNPDARLPKVQLYAESENKFFIKEVAELKFEFIKDTNKNVVKAVTYNSRGKDAEWKKIK